MAVVLGGCGCAPALAAALPPADGGGRWGVACSVQSYCCKRSPCKRLSVQRGGPSHVVGSWMSLPGLLSRACKGAQEGNKPGVGRVGGSVTGDGVGRHRNRGGKNISVFVASPTGLLEILQQRGRRAARRRAAFRTLQQLEFVYPAGAPK